MRGMIVRGMDHEGYGVCRSLDVSAFAVGML